MIPKTTLVWFCLAVTSTEAIQVMLESFIGCNSSGVISCSLRVHKVNRTTATLIGNMTYNVDLGQDFATTIDFYRSSLGNSQFNHYPMKIGPIGLCDFIGDSWEDYLPYLVDSIPNLPKVGECPLTQRTLPVYDLVLDARMFPPWMRPGLWLLIWTIRDKSAANYIRMDISFKVYENGHF